MENKNVQRLHDNDHARVLGNLIKHDAEILQLRQNYLDSGKTGNTKELREYKEKLPPLDNGRLQYCVGLTLGDTSVQAGSDDSYRLKTQQSEDHISLLDAKKAVLLPWVMHGPSPISTREGMFELDTIKSKSFKPIADILHNPTKPLKTDDCIDKVITRAVKPYLTPIAIGAWFCCDGGRRDYGVNEGKAIQLHTQGFSQQSCELLANFLKEIYGWNAKAKFDYTDKTGRKRYLIQIEAESFESFIKLVSPHILERFKKRLPSPRSPRSNFNKKP